LLITQFFELQDIFTNTRQPWQPPGARGIFGGAVIAQCLAAAQRTIPEDLIVHSCHCYFLLAGSSDIPILFHVERVRDGRSFATRTVQARQRGKCIFTTTISFARESPDGDKEVRHAAPMPLGVSAPPDDWEPHPDSLQQGPFYSRGIEVINGKDKTKKPHERKTQQWVRARGQIKGGLQAHLNALAYMSDSYFIGTVGRIHNLWRFPFTPSEFKNESQATQEMLKRILEFEGLDGNPENWDENTPRVGMMVSLDHSIYFHEPKKLRADEWMFSEMESPWSGGGRGVVTQRIFAKDGTLLATCVQEVSSSTSGRLRPLSP
jgi:acyl-CoA thioesterase 8